ncbi:MAG TPA: PhoH family protein [Firmicutes bacterium]|nr:PhoH family protein [Bacillota bacterium]
MAASVKHFILDTNVLLHDFHSLFNFEEHYVYIPIDVLEELDRFKSDLGERGRNARRVIRSLDSLSRGNNLLNGIPLNEKGGKLFILIDFESSLPQGIDRRNTDNRIIMAAKHLQDKGYSNVIFVSMDINARVKAEALSITAEVYEHTKIDLSELYAGTGEYTVDKSHIDSFHQNGALPCPRGMFYPNQMINISPGGKEAIPSRCSGEALIPLKSQGIYPWGIKPLNREQSYALELLLDDNIKLVTLIGQAGTGKTLLTLAAGLHKVTEEQKYKKVLVMRPIMPMGRDIGYLPGSKENKLENWMEPIFDNLDFVVDANHLGKKNRSYFLTSDIIELEALTFIRGRSISSQYILIDEAQNLTPHEIKTIVSRAGNQSKIILTGDPHQIDNPYLDAESNGLTYLIQRFKGEPIFGHITLVKSERSELASLAADIL